MKTEKKPDGVSSRPASEVDHVGELSRKDGASRKLQIVADAGHDYTRGPKIDHALALARAGFRVFPLQPNTKIPYEKTPPISAWVKTATTNETTLRDWWNRWPESNIGILTTGRLVVDIDVKKDKDGYREWDVLRFGGLDVPPTRTHRTPSGGEHLLFDCREDVANDATGKLAHGLDIRGKNGYVVGPGSTVDGVPYAVIDSRPPVRAPDDLVARCKKPRERPTDVATVPPACIDQEAAERRARHYLANDAPHAIEGQGGHNRTYSVACRVKDFGVGEAHCLALMDEVYNHCPRCDPPWDSAELTRIVSSAYRNGREPPGCAAADLEFAAVDIFEGAHAWTREHLEANADALLALEAEDPDRFANVRDTVAMFGVADDFDQILADARLRTDSSVDVLAIVAEPARAHGDDFATQLATLKKTNPELLERVRERLTAGRKPVVGKRAFDGQVKRGEALAIRAAAENEATARDKRIVYYDAAHLPECCDEIEAALIADFGQDRERVLAYGGAYVTIRQRAPTVVSQLTGEAYPAQPLVFRYDAPALRERVMRSVALMTKGAGDAIRCPDEVVQTLISRRGGSAPPLAGIIEAPTLRPDGTLLDAPGYDAATGLYAWFDPAAFPSISMSPTQDKAAEALTFLRNEFLDEFEFASPVDRDVAIAALLTALLRRTLPDVPGFVFSAPQQSSGKTALANAISGAAFGRPAAAVGWPRSDEEMGKMLIGLLQQGQTAICFDNARDGSALASTELARAMTSPTFGGRLLGVNEHAEFPTNVIWFITGNNTVPAADLTTRFLSCALQPSVARPDQRTFRRDLASWVAQNRARAVAAGLTILRAYRVAGAPPTSGTPSRFRTWDANVRFALVYAGGLDVGMKFDEADLADSALGALRRLLKLWPAVMGVEGVRAKDIEQKCAFAGSDTEKEFVEALRDLMVESKGKDISSAHAIGACLKQWRDRIAGGYRLVRMHNRHEEVTLWRAAPVGAGD